MAAKKDDFMKKLMATFRVEAEEHLTAITDGLLELEKKPPAKRESDIIEAIFREAHSLKGAARSVSMASVEQICQALESVFADVKKGKKTLTTTMFDVLHRVIDHVAFMASFTGGAVDEEVNKRFIQAEELLSGVESSDHDAASATPAEQGFGEGEGGEALSHVHYTGIDEMQMSGDGKDTELDIAKRATSAFESVRISVSRLDELLLKVEELLSGKISLSQRLDELSEIVQIFEAWKKYQKDIYPSLRKMRPFLEREPLSEEQKEVRSLMESMVTFFDVTSDHCLSVEKRLIQLRKSVSSDVTSISTMVNNLLTDTKETLMLPFSAILGYLPKFVRDLSRDRNKKVELIIEGAETSADRRILEELRDPLMHMIRNCIDHGIERPRERSEKRKRETGLISITIGREEGNNIHITLSDDGGGVDIERVKEISVKRGIISKAAAENMADEDILTLLYQSGVSTSPIITDISGRGLGLAIVQEKIRSIGGTISVKSRLGEGTRFDMSMPLTLATFRGTLVRVAEEQFIIPTASIRRIARARRDEMGTIENRKTFPLDGEVLSYVPLGTVLEISRNNASDSEYITSVILGSGAEWTAFGVDGVIGEEEVLVKGLGSNLSRVRNIAGATILGTGDVVPILNVSDLIKSAVHAAALPRGPELPEKPEEERQKSILVVEDSITSRMLLKNILEAAGYAVKTAIDGMDGFTTLKEEQFDMVVSDVDMPRLNGFGLTAKIRSDKKLSELPVVLVTALESREDRERGIDVGADAYIVKRSFDQSNLLEVVRRLI